MALLEIDNLQVHFRTSQGINRAVDGVSLHVHPGETLAIVGESGSGKSVTASAILRLIPEPAGRIAGSIRFDGQELLTLPNRAMRAVRGKQISIVFQEPMTSLNPVFTVGAQVARTIRLHEQTSAAEARRRAVAMLELVGIPEPRRHMRSYPHRLSGGMQQRIMIAAALACRPKLLIADEPTTALDVTIQAQILDLLRGLKSQLGMAMLLITHDVGVVEDVAQRVVVMYAGRKVEDAPVAQLLHDPRHPYTQGLLAAVPRIGGKHTGRKRLAEIPGSLPAPGQRVNGCVFAPRCPIATDTCRQFAPALELKAPAHWAACHYAVKELAP